MRTLPLIPLSVLITSLAANPQAAEDVLVDYIVENASSIPAPLVEVETSGANGPSLFESAGCAECHAAPGYEDAPAIGPELYGVGDRLTAGEIRLMIVNPAILLPQTDMPAYYSIGQIGEVSDDLVGRTRLTAVEVEELVGWLATVAE